MDSIIKCYKQSVPAMRFIGRCYGEDDRVDGSFGAKWGEWFAGNLFEPLKVDDAPPADYEDHDAFIGLMRHKEGEPFQYWIGAFAPVDAAVPEGYSCVDFLEATLGVCWIRGQEHEVYGKEDKCFQRMAQEGYTVKPDANGAIWAFERYGCPRFTTPDAEGEIILDICTYIE